MLMYLHCNPGKIVLEFGLLLTNIVFFLPSTPQLACLHLEFILKVASILESLLKGFKTWQSQQNVFV